MNELEREAYEEQRTIKQYQQTIELTVNAPLSEGAKTSITDKFTSDPLITYITFA